MDLGRDHRLQDRLLPVSGAGRPAAGDGVERTGDLVPVKVDCDDTTEKNGYQDAALASLYAVQGTPALALVDSGGRVLARTNGYQSAREFLEWLERSLAAVGRNTPDDGVRISGASI